MEQGNLVFQKKPEAVPEVTVVKCKDMKAAVRMCVEVSGIEVQDVAFQLGIETGHLNRMLNPNDDRHFPLNKLNDLMSVTGNEVPLEWLARTRGYKLERLKSKVEEENEELRQRIEHMERERHAIASFFRSAGIDVKLAS